MIGDDKWLEKALELARENRVTLAFEGGPLPDDPNILVLHMSDFIVVESLVIEWPKKNA